MKGYKNTINLVLQKRILYYIVLIHGMVKIYSHIQITDCSTPHNAKKIKQTKNSIEVLKVYCDFCRALIEPNKKTDDVDAFLCMSDHALC